MSITRDVATYENAIAYGGLIDAIGGVATIVLAICGLVNIIPAYLAAIATIVFGVALLIQGGAMVSEYAQVVFPAETREFSGEFSGNSLAVVFLAGVAGIVLGVLSLLHLVPNVLTPIAIIAFGAALVFSSNAVWQLFLLRRTMRPGGARGGELLASEMASGSAGLQALAGMTAIVLGILALAGLNELTLSLVALLVLGSALVLTGSTLSATVVSFMKT